MNIRHNIRLAAVLAATVLAAGCGKRQNGVRTRSRADRRKGFLVLAGMNVGITTEVETLENGDLAAQAATRAATEADGAYLVQINSTTATQEGRLVGQLRRHQGHDRTSVAGPGPLYDRGAVARGDTRRGVETPAMPAPPNAPSSRSRRRR